MKKYQNKFLIAVRFSSIVLLIMFAATSSITEVFAAPYIVRSLSHEGAGSAISFHLQCV